MKCFIPIFFSCKKFDCPFKSHPFNSMIFILLCVIIQTCLFPFHKIYAWSIPSPPPWVSHLKAHAWFSTWVTKWFLTLFSPAALQRPGAGNYLALFRLLVWELHCLDHSYWSMVWLYRPFLLVALTIHEICVNGPVVLACCVCLGGFNNSLWCFWAGDVSMFSYFYSLDTIPSIIV
jgi:hypothetical protein